MTMATAVAGWRLLPIFSLHCCSVLKNSQQVERKTELNENRTLCLTLEVLSAAVYRQALDGV